MFNLSSPFVSRQHAVCLLSGQGVTCYASQGRQQRLIWDVQDIGQSLASLFSCLQAWRVRYLTLLLDTNDETLFYEQTPRLYPWEITRYAQRQTAKRFAHLQGMTGYRYVRLGRSSVWQAESYLLLSFSVSESTLVAQAWQALLSRLEGQSEIWLVSILSLSLLLADDTRRSPQQAQAQTTPTQTKGRLWWVSWQGQARQLLCYRGLLLIQRSLKLTNETPEDQANKMTDENQLLMRFLHTQTHQGIQVDAIDHHLYQRDILLDHLLDQQVKQFPYRSDYHPTQVEVWQKWLRWQRAITLILMLSLLIGVLLSLGFYWQKQETEQANAELSRSLQQGQQEKSATIETSLAFLPEITPEQLEARVQWMQSWHRLKMNLDPTPLLTQVAEVLATFPSIHLTAMAYHNGPPHSASAEVLDVNRASLRLTAQIDAQAFHSLAEEEVSLQAFTQALSTIARVRQVEVLRNPVLTLANQPMTLMFSQSAEEAVLHPLLLVLHLRPDTEPTQGE